MAKSIEKLIKIEAPRKISEMKLNPIDFPALHKLDLTDIEHGIEPGTAVHIDLGLDQIEEE